MRDEPSLAVKHQATLLSMFMHTAGKNGISPFQGIIAQYRDMYEDMGYQGGPPEGAPTPEQAENAMRVISEKARMIESAPNLRLSFMPILDSLGSYAQMQCKYEEGKAFTGVDADDLKPVGVLARVRALLWDYAPNKIDFHNPAADYNNQNMNYADATNFIVGHVANIIGVLEDFQKNPRTPHSGPRGF